MRYIRILPVNYFRQVITQNQMLLLTTEKSQVSGVGRHMSHRVTSTATSIYIRRSIVLCVRHRRIYIYVLHCKYSVRSLAHQVIQLWRCEHVGQVLPSDE